MDALAEPIRYTTSLFALVTAFAMARALNPPRLAWVWAISVSAAGMFFTHVAKGLPTPVLVPIGVGLGLVFALGALSTGPTRAAFERLDDGQWRSLMSLRAVFGALLLAAAGVGLMPVAFAVPAGLGDLLAGGLALTVPTSLGRGGNRTLRLAVFGVGLVDFINVLRLMVLVLVPWLLESGSVGISLLLPWLAVPLLATLNVAGLRLALREPTAAAEPSRA